jgi:hypothetical protein
MNGIDERHRDIFCNFAVDFVRLSGGEMETEEAGINPWRNRMRINVAEKAVEKQPPLGNRPRCF